MATARRFFIASVLRTKPSLVRTADRTDAQLLFHGGRHDAVHRGVLIGAASADDGLGLAAGGDLRATAQRNRGLACGAVVVAATRAGTSALRSAWAASGGTDVGGNGQAGRGRLRRRIAGR